MKSKTKSQSTLNNEPQIFINNIRIISDYCFNENIYYHNVMSSLPGREKDMKP